MCGGGSFVLVKRAALRDPREHKRDRDHAEDHDHAAEGAAEEEAEH
jgi:hypothetical protein